MIEAVKQSSQDITDKQPRKNSDVVEIVDKEETDKEATPHENVAKFYKLEDVDKSTEQVEARKPVKVDAHVQTDYESFENIYVEHDKALKKIKSLEDKVNLYRATIRKVRANMATKKSGSTSNRGAAGRL